MVAVEVAIVAATVCLALAPLPPLPGETALPPASVLILPLAEELKVILRDVSWAASARPGFTIGKTSANTNNKVAAKAKNRLGKKLVFAISK